MTAGAIEGHRRGIVTACSVVACGRELGDAVEALKQVPSLAVGAHLALVGESPVLPASAVATLVDRSGRFFADFRHFAARYSLGRIRLADVERELRAQIEKLLSAGLTLTHLNSHQHLHILPRIFAVVAGLAGEFGIRYVRVPDESVLQGVSRRRRLEMRVLRSLGKRARTGLAARSIAFADRTAGIHDAGHLDGAGLLRLIGDIEGAVELVTHPATNTEEIATTYDWGYEWEGELEALTDRAVRAALDARGIELCTPGELAGRMTDDR